MDTLDAHGVTAESPADLAALTEARGGIVVRMVVSQAADRVLGDTQWEVGGRYLSDLGPTYANDPVTQAVGGAPVFIDGEWTTTAIGREKTRWAWIPGPDVWDRLEHGRER